MTAASEPAAVTSRLCASAPWAGPAAGREMGRQQGFSPNGNFVGCRQTRAPADRHPRKAASSARHRPPCPRCCFVSQPLYKLNSI